MNSNVVSSCSICGGERDNIETPSESFKSPASAHDSLPKELTTPAPRQGGNSPQLIVSANARFRSPPRPNPIDFNHDSNQDDDDDDNSGGIAGRGEPDEQKMNLGSFILPLAQAERKKKNKKKRKIADAASKKAKKLKKAPQSELSDDDFERGLVFLRVLEQGPGAAFVGIKLANSKKIYLGRLNGVNFETKTFTVVFAGDRIKRYQFPVSCCREPAWTMKRVVHSVTKNQTCSLCPVGSKVGLALGDHVLFQSTLRFFA